MDNAQMKIKQGLSNRQTTYVRKLKQKKYRQKFSAYIAEGTKIAIEALNQCPQQIEILCATRQWYVRQADLLPDEPSFYIRSDKKTLDELSGLESSQGVFVVLSKPESRTDRGNTQSLFIYLDGVQDPGNVGTIIRTADWFGMDQIFYGPGTVDPYNSKVVQASMGSLFRITPRFASIEELEKIIGEQHWTSASPEGIPVGEWQPREPEVLIIGNEGAGVSKEIIKRTERTVSIPSAGEGQRAESLNAAVSCGILISHWMEKTKGKTGL